MRWSYTLYCLRIAIFAYPIGIRRPGYDTISPTPHSPIRKEMRSVEQSHCRNYVKKTASSRKISLRSDNRLPSCGQKRTRPSAILNFKNVHIWSHDCDQVPNLLLYATFHQNRIERFSRWYLSAIFNFKGPRMSSLKSPCIWFPVGRQQRS